MFRSYAVWRKSNPQAPIDVFRLDIRRVDQTVQYWVDGENITDQIRDQAIGGLASELSQQVSVRKFLRELQRDLAKGVDVVFEGRDMGSVVFPHATYKFFLKANLEVRAQRRLQELRGRFPEKKESFLIEDISQELQQRDDRDENRAESPLIVPNGAIVIDTSKLTIDQVCDSICQKIEGK
jgi:cytidylate kinase